MLLIGFHIFALLMELGCLFDYINDSSSRQSSRGNPAACNVFQQPGCLKGEHYDQQKAEADLAARSTAFALRYNQFPVSMTAMIDKV